jgi:hypothetical protein
MTSSFRICAVLLLAGLGLGAARADTFDFSYSGAGDPGGDFAGVTASGSGSFTTNDSNNPAVATDLSNFSFFLTVTDGVNVDTENFGLGDLLTFSASFDDGLLTDLALTTNPLEGNWFPNEALSVTDLGAGDASTGNSDVTVTTGAVTADGTATPEPATLSLMAGALALGFGAVRRRRNAR